MRIAAAQISVTPEEIELNTKKMVSYIAQAKERNVDIVVFPEMSDTGYALPLSIKSAQEWDKGTVPALKAAAKEHKLNVIAGISEKTADGVFNSAIIIDRAGNEITRYRKTHLCALKPFCEEQFFSAGDKLTIAEIESVQCGVLICYDIRFPEIAHTLASQGAEIIIYLAAFPMARIQHWTTLLTARALDNQVFIVACNRVGKDADLSFCGASMIIDPYGTTVSSGSAIHEGLIIGDLDMDLVKTVRSQFPYLKDRRPALYAQ